MGLDIIVYNKKKEFLYSFRAGAYSYFNKFRNFIMNNVIEMKNQRNVDLFIDFLIHSDCQNKLGLKSCKKLLKGFECDEFKEQLLLEFLSDENKYLLESLEDWKRGLKLAIKHKGYLVFC